MNPKNTSVSPELDGYWGDPTGGAEIETSLSDYESRAYKSPEFFINKDVLEFKNDFQNYLEAKKTHVSKFTLPFTQTNEGCVGRPIDFEFRPGELTVLAGENGSGKSLLLGQIGLHLISCGASLYIASFEMAPVRTIERMLMQTVCSKNKRKIEAPDVDLFFRQFASKMRICDLQRKVTPNELLRLLDSAVHDYQSNILFVDSLMMCVRDDMDKKETDYVMGKLVEFAKVNNVHIVVVAHCRKRGDGGSKTYSVFDSATKESIKGSSNITNIAFNVFVLARDFSKVQKKAEGKDVDDTKPDFVLNLCKQRNGAWEGFIKLWRDNASLNFCTSWTRVPVRPWLELTQSDPAPEPYF